MIVGEYLNIFFPNGDFMVGRSRKEIRSACTGGLDVDDGVGGGCFFCEGEGVPTLLLAAASLAARPFFFFFGILVIRNEYNL